MRTLPRTLRDRVLEITYTDKLRGADELEVSLANDDLALFDDPMLAPRNQLQVQWGYAHEMGPVRIVRIKEITGWSVLRLKCVSVAELAAMSRERIRVFPNYTVGEIAREVARDLGYTDGATLDIEEVDQPVTYETLYQTGQTDRAFLQALADRFDFVFRLSSGRFEFHPHRLGELPARTLIYFSSPTGDFTAEPQITKGDLGIPGRVTRRGHSVRARGAVEGEASNATDTQRPALGERCLVPVIDSPGSWRAATTPAGHAVTGRTSSESDAEATRHARNQFRAAERRAIEMEWDLIGMPSLAAGQVVHVLGFGQRLSGNYHLQEVTHRIGSSGYTCHATARRNAESASGAGRAAGTAAADRHAARLAQEQDQWSRQYAEGRITLAEYQRRTRSVGANVAAAARNDHSGRQNNKAPPNTPTEEVRVADPDHPGRWLVQYRRRAAVTSGPARTNNPPGESG
jgi:phage protein D